MTFKGAYTCEISDLIRNIKAENKSEARKQFKQDLIAYLTEIGLTVDEDSIQIRLEQVQ